MPPESQRAAIYARYSTDLQSGRSIEDQISLCRDHAEKAQLQVCQTFVDRARSGASVHGRQGLSDLIEAARTRQFDVLVVEALDRLSRDVGDLANLFRQLNFLGVRVLAVHDGEASTLLVGLRGLVAQLSREDSAKKVRRGLLGRVKDGLSAGGQTYGYEPVPGQPGKLQIISSEAAIIKEIFEAYAAGVSPRKIAQRLNQRGLLSPRGRRWNASTINGSRNRGTGILQNSLYAGRISWGKVEMIKNPDTGRRISRSRPKSEWQHAEVPDLAIVSQELFSAVQERKEALAKIHPSHQQRPKHILSGLLRCGACGSGMSTSGKDRSGRVRIRCSASRESGSCPSPRTFYLDTVQDLVLSTLRAELQSPAVLAEFVREYQAERERLAANAHVERARLEERLIAIGREADRVTDMLVRQVGDEARLDARAKELAVEEAELKVRLSGLVEAPRPASLHPSVLERYEQQLARLAESLNAGIEAGESDASDALRDLVQTTTVRRMASGETEIEISGRLTALLGEHHFPNRLRGVCGLVVAEDRSGLNNRHQNSINLGRWRGLPPRPIALP